MATTNNTKQAFWVAIGSFFSLIVGIVSPMILSRYFSQDDYGTYKQVMYVYNTLLAVFTLGLPRAYAYFLPKNDITYSKDIINKITRLFFILGLIFSLSLMTGAGFIADALNNKDLKTALIVFSPAPLLLLPTMGLDGIFATYKRTQLVALYTVITRIVTILFTLAPVLIWDGNYIDALLGFDIASLITCLIALYLRNLPIKNISHKKSSVTYRHILNFSIPLLYASIWGIICSSADQFFVSRYFGNTQFAIFSNGFMELPFIGMIIGAIGVVLMPVFSKIDNEQEMSKSGMEIWNSSILKSGKLIFPMLIFSIVFARLFMTCLYGDLYASSAPYFQLKNFGSMFYIIPFAPIILAMGQTKAYANAHMIAAILIVCGEYIVSVTLSSAIYIAIVSTLCLIIKIMILTKIVAKYLKRPVLKLIPIKSFAHIIGVSFVAAAIPYIVVSMTPLNKFIAFSIAIALFILIYYIMCWLTNLSYKNIVSSFLKPEKTAFLIKLIP